jgi:hypothetical protein
VTILGKVTTLTCVTFGNLVAMGTELIIRGRRNRFERGTVIAFRLEQSSDVLECLITFFQLLCKATMENVCYQ